jgi:hypothetical protein
MSERRMQEDVRGTEGKARTMKHATGKALGIAGCLGVIGACAALIAGKDDIRKFHRMRSM